AHVAAARQLFSSKLTLNNHLCCDTGVVHTRLPKNILASHALKADHDVLKRIVERMAHVQRASDIWWRNDDGECFRARLSVCTSAKCISIIPRLSNFRFYGCGIVGLLKHFLTCFLCAKLLRF